MINGKIESLRPSYTYTHIYQDFFKNMFFLGGFVLFGFFFNGRKDEDKKRENIRKETIQSNLFRYTHTYIAI